MTTEMDTDILDRFKRRTTLRQIEILCMVRQTGSITAAAQALNMSAANVSRACQRFEQNMGAPIFRKTRKGVLLTARGQSLIDALQILNEAIATFPQGWQEEADLEPSR